MFRSVWLNWVTLTVCVLVAVVPWFIVPPLILGAGEPEWVDVRAWFAFPIMFWFIGCLHVNGYFKDLAAEESEEQ